MLDKEYIEKSSWYTSVADAIRNKKGTTDPILRDDFASEISSITGGEETPEYDGTVIIEKAGVRGLRRFKDRVESITTIQVTKNTDVEQLGRSIFNQYGFDIELISVPTIEGFNLVGMSCLVNVDRSQMGIEGITQGIAYALLNDDNSVSYTFNIDYEIFLELHEQFTVTKTANATVAEWLLANTEGVSV